MAVLTSTSMRSGILAFISGFVDTIFFIALGGIFVGLVTGNVILLGLGLVGHAKGGLSAMQALTFPSFIIGAATAAIVSKFITSKTRATCISLSLAGCAFLVSAVVSPVGGATPLVSTMLAAVAMGILTAADRLDTALGPPFSLMTGNIAGVAISLGRYLSGQNETDSEKAASKTALILLIGFIAGAVCGAFAQQMAGIPAVAIAGILMFIIVVMYAQASRAVASTESTAKTSTP